MKKGSMICFLEIISLIFFLFLNIFVFNIKSVYLLSFIFIIPIIISFIFLGYQKDNFRNKKDILMLIITNLLVYFIVTYIFGIIVGFLRNGYSLQIEKIIGNIFPYLLMIIIREIFRYLYFSKAKESKFLIVLGIFAFILLDISLNLHLYNITKTEGMVKMLCLVFFPSVSKNIFLSYLTVVSGYKNAIIYSCIMELNKFVLPIFPDFGEYINTLITVIFPIYLTLSINSSLKFKEVRKIQSSRYHSNNLLFYSIITFSLLTIIMLTSGFFRYYALTIGSSSMEKAILKGDVVIVKKLKRKELKGLKVKKDILVYNHDGKIIVHRLVKIKKMNDQILYITKGDNNLTKDSYFIKQKEVIGKVSFTIRYIGMPTVALNERMNK